MEKEESSKGGSVGFSSIILGIIFLILGFLVGFVIAPYLTGESKSENETVENEKENNEDDSKDEDIPKLDINSFVVKELFEVFKEDNCLESDIFQNLNDDVSAKMYLAYSELDETDFTEMRCGSLDDSYVNGNYCAMNSEAMQYYGSDESKYESAIINEKTKVVSAVTLERKYKEIFGQNANYNNATFDLLEGPIAYYDKVNNVYAYFSCECGGECGSNHNHVLNSVSQDGTKLTLNTTLSISSYDGNVTKNVVYTFEYEKSTGNYIFVSRVEK